MAEGVEKKLWFASAVFGSMRALTNSYILNKPYENEVTLTEQNSPVSCQPLAASTQLKRGLDL